MVVGTLEVFEKFRVVAQEEVWCGTGGSMVDGTGGSMVWHRRKYGGVLRIEYAKVQRSF